RFEIFIQILILISIVCFSIDTLPNISNELSEILKGFELFSIAIFSVEYLMRVCVSKKPLNYIFSFYGIIDLMAILPFYFTGVLDLRFMRAFRILKIFRVAKLIKYNDALNRFKKAFAIVKEEIVLFFLITIVLVFTTSAGIYYFEHEAQPEVFKSVFHSAWWSIVTLTTVGYGDVYPITLGGKIFTFFVLIIGVGIITIPAGLVATALLKSIDNEKTEN
ncbi:ion transporter, partial [Flavobacteriaceae bacterium]|nr:ion transporter [Flavobacteriaceae bacterium]